MNSSCSNNNRSLKVKLSPLKLSTFLNKNNFSESKTNPENTSKTLVNSMRYLSTFNDSSNESIKMNIIKKPYKIFLPLRTNIKKIKNNRLISLNNYYKNSLKKDFFLRGIMDFNNSTNIKFNNDSKENISISQINNFRNLKSSFNNSKSNNNNLSKNAAIISTERTSTLKDLTNYNISNISKVNNYDKYNIFSYSNKNLNLSNNNSIFNNSSIINTYNEFIPMRFVNFNQGYKNIKNIKHCVKDFTNQIKNLRKEKYFNYILKERTSTSKENTEVNNEQFRMDSYKKYENRNLFDIFYKDYNTYYNKIKTKEKKYSDKRGLLDWEILSYKSEVNRLNIKKDKLLSRLNKYIQMKQFLITLRNYSLDRKHESFSFGKISRKDIKYEDLIKDRRIKTDNNEDSIFEDRKGLRRSMDFQNIGKLNDIKLTEENINKGKKKLKRLYSLAEKSPLQGSEIKEISTILNNHIANLLIYHNHLRLEIEPLKEEFDCLYKSFKENDEKKNKLLKLQFLILPEKKRIIKERNEFLKNTLFNIKNNLCDSSGYHKMNKSIVEKLNEIYKLLLNNKIINFSKMKPSKEDNIVEKTLFYLKNIERGLDFLIKSKKIFIENYPEKYDEVIQDLNNKIKLKSLQSVRKFSGNNRAKILNEINKKEKILILNRRKDYYRYGYKKDTKKIKLKKVDPYEELRYSDDNSSEENNNNK